MPTPLDIQNRAILNTMFSSLFSKQFKFSGHEKENKLNSKKSG
jgi:hypothetical protein